MVRVVIVKCDILGLYILYLMWKKCVELWRCVRLELINLLRGGP